MKRIYGIWNQYCLSFNILLFFAATSRCQLFFESAQIHPNMITRKREFDAKCEERKIVPRCFGFWMPYSPNFRIFDQLFGVTGKRIRSHAAPKTRCTSKYDDVIQIDQQETTGRHTLQLSNY